MDEGRVGSTAGLCVVGVLCALCGVAPARALPGAEGEGGVLEATGEAHYRIPLELPAGAAGHTPDVALEYRSGDGRGAADVFGFGWTLSAASRIQRDVRRGPRRWCSAGEASQICPGDYELDGQRLICESGDCLNCAGAACAGRYRTRRDDGRRIERLAAGQGWRILDREGRTWRYGAASDGRSRRLDPYTGEVFAWQLEEVVDGSGNWIRYTWDLQSSPGHALLVRIGWAQSGCSLANRTLTIEYEPRPDPERDGRAGFARVLEQRARALEVRAAGDARVSRHELRYAQDPLNRRSLLVEVERQGRDPLAVLPPWQFEYTRFEAAGGGPARFEPWPDPGFEQGAGALPLAVTGDVLDAATLDVDGDALADVYDAFAGVAAETKRCANHGTRFAACETWHPSALSLREASEGAPPLSRSWNETRVTTLDSDGDRLPDRLRQGLGTDDRFVRFGQRSGPGDAELPVLDRPADPQRFWGLADDVFGIPEGAHALEQTRDGRQIVALADVTGDGLPDRVLALPRAGPFVFAIGEPGEPSSFDAAWRARDDAWMVLPGQGRAADGSALEFGAPLVWSVPDPYSGIAESENNVAPSFSPLLADADGDGLADRVWADLSYDPNLGSGFGARVWPDPPIAWSDPDNVAFLPTGSHPARSASGPCAVSDLLDLNGDGFLDAVVSYRHVQPTDARTEWKVFFGTASGWNTTPYLFDTPDDAAARVRHRCLTQPYGGGVSGPEVGALADVNADRLPDSLVGTSDRVHLADGQVPGLLARVRDPRGGVQTWSWSWSAQQRDDSDRPGNPQLPRSRPVVAERVRADGRPGTPDIVDRFRWLEGELDPDSGGFAGFARVERRELDAGGAVSARVASRFRVDPGCAGALVSRETRDALDRVLQREAWSWLETGAAPWSRCLLAEHERVAVEGDEASARTSRTRYDYGTPLDPLHRLQRRTELGDVAESGDERETLFVYATPEPDSHVVDAIAERIVRAPGDPERVFVHERRRYDGLPQGSVGAGRLTQVLQRLAPSPLGAAGGTWIPTRRFEHDPHGNVVAEIGAPTADDPDGLRSETAFDPEYAAHPISLARGADLGSGALVHSFDHDGCLGDAPPPGLGRVCVAADPRGVLTRRGYDAFGREVARERAGLSETRSYDAPDPADPDPLGRIERRRSRPGAPDLVDVAWLDGLDRPVRWSTPGAEGESVLEEVSYDARGRVATWRPQHLAGESRGAFAYRYDALGRPLEVVQPESGTSGAASGPVRSTYARAGRREIRTVQVGEGAAATTLERREQVLDGLGRLRESVVYLDPLTPAQPLRTRLSYDPADRPLAIADPIANDPSLCGDDPLCPGQRHVTHLSWDSLGRRVGLDHPDTGLWSFEFDAAGRPIRRVDAAGREQRIAYDGLGRPVSRSFTPTGAGTLDADLLYHETPGEPGFGLLAEVASEQPGADGEAWRDRFQYDAQGRLTTRTRELSGYAFVERFAWDELGRLRERTFPDGERFHWQWSGARLAAIVGDPGNAGWAQPVLRAASWTADGRPRALEAGPLVAGGRPALEEIRTYGSDGRIASLVARPGRGATPDQDGDGLADTSDLCPWYASANQSDQDGDGIGDVCQCGDADGNGRLDLLDLFAVSDAILDPALATELCDANGDDACNLADLFAINDALLGATATCARHPDTALPPAAGDLRFEPELDGLGRLVALRGDLFGETLDRAFGYDGASRLVSARGPWEPDLAAGESVTWQWSWDALGNPRRQTSSRGDAGSERSWSYGDPLRPHLLTGFERSRGLAPAAPPRSEAIAYDATGHPVAIDGAAVVWNAQQRLHARGAARIHYDLEGRRLISERIGADPTRVLHVFDDFEYDVATGVGSKRFRVAGRPLASLALGYAPEPAPAGGRLGPLLDALRPLAAPTASGLGWILRGLLAALALAGPLSWLARLRRRAEAPPWVGAPGAALLALAVIVATPAGAQPPASGPLPHGGHAEPFVALATDLAGSVVAAVDAAGRVLETRDWTPFGQRIRTTGAYALNPGFAGHVREPGTGWLVTGSRTYDPGWGRFTSPDEAIEGVDPAGLNPYAYVRNQPLHRIDPDGRASAPIVAAAAASLGAGSGVLAALGVSSSSLDVAKALAAFLSAAALVLTALTAGTLVAIALAVAIALTLTYGAVLAALAFEGLTRTPRAETVPTGAAAAGGGGGSGAGGGGGPPGSSARPEAGAATGARVGAQRVQSGAAAAFSAPVFFFSLVFGI